MCLHPPPPQKNYDYIPNHSNLIITTLASLLWQNNMAHLFLPMDSFC